MVIRHHRAPPTAREVSCLLGKFNSASQAIPPGPLFCRAIQRDLAMALDASKQCYDAFPSCHRGAAVVEKSLYSLEWEESGAKAARPLDRVRCLPHRMGSIMPGYSDGRPMVPAREDTPHKRPGAACSYTSGEDIPERSGKQESTAAAGQSDSSCLYKQPGRDSLRPRHKAGRDLWMWCLWRDILLTAQYLPGKENLKADTELRVMRDRSD